MKLTWAIRLLAALGAVALTITVVNANDGAMTFRATMSGFNEVAPILTNGSGTFHATINGNSMTYTETFSGLSAPVTASHIHFGEKGVNGNVFVFLCSNGAAPAGTPACPAGGGTVTRTVTAADVLGVATQNIPAGDFAALLRILRSGDAYVNVHTMKFPGGEIRGQVRIGDD